MIGLLPPEVDGIWGPPSRASRRLLVVDEERADDPQIADARRAGKIVGVYFDPFTMPVQRRATVPIRGLEFAIGMSESAARLRGLVAMDDPAALGEVVARARNLAQKSFDVYFISTRSPLRSLARYGEASRDVSVSATGLDPLDFRTTKEVEGMELTPSERLPAPLIAALARTGKARFRDAIRPLERRKLVFLINPLLPDLPQEERLVARADWSKALDTPGLAGLAMRPAGVDSYTLIAEVRKRSRLPIRWVGAETDFKDHTAPGPRLLRVTDRTTSAPRDGA